MSDAGIRTELRGSATHVLLDPDRGDRLEADLVSLDDEQEHHLRRVLRLRDGDAVSVTDGAGRWRMTAARVASSVELEATGDVHRLERDELFTIASAIPKGDRLDQLVQKTVEVGVDRVQLIDAARSVVRWRGDRGVKQLARLQRIADEALRQSRRVWRAEVLGPVPALEILPHAAAAEPGGAAIAGDEAIIAIGPEGGWAPEELVCARATVSVGANILRIETAAIAATTLRLARPRRVL